MSNTIYLNSHPCEPVVLMYLSKNKTTFLHERFVGYYDRWVKNIIAETENVKIISDQDYKKTLSDYKEESLQFKV